MKGNFVVRQELLLMVFFLKVFIIYGYIYLWFKINITN